MVALPGEYTINARQAHPLHRVFAYTDDDDNPIDLTGYTAFMPVRRQYHSGKLLFQLDTEPGGGITIDGPAGEITVSVDAAFMRDVQTGTGYYDLVLVPAGDMNQKFAILTGEFRIHQRVRPEEANNG